MRNKDYVIVILIMACTTAGAIGLDRLGISNETILMAFMIGVLLVTAYTRGYRFGIIASSVSVIIFNYFFTEPVHTFHITNTDDMTLMLVFYIASIISSSLSARFQRQLLISQKNEETAKLLYEVARSFLNVTGEENIMQQGIAYIKEHLGYDCVVELNVNGKSQVSDRAVPISEKKCLELPIKGITRSLGVLKVYETNGEFDSEHESLISTVSAQMGIALDRELVYNEREKIRVAMEREHLKSNLLRSIGHDLRTPLTGIVGASGYIAQRSEKALDRKTITRLARDINEQAVWLTALVGNILNMTRIDNGSLAIDKQIEVIDDVVNEAVAHVVEPLDKPLKISLPTEVLAVPMDGKLIVQVLVNLLNNAVIHTPRGSDIELTVEKIGNHVEFSVADSGDGIEPSIEDRLFDAFVTSGKQGSDGEKGLGLGLAICEAVVKAHGGSIRTGVSSLGGALFAFTLPLAEDE